MFNSKCEVALGRTGRCVHWCICAFILESSPPGKNTENWARENPLRKGLSCISWVSHSCETNWICFVFCLDVCLLQQILGAAGYP